jgi:CBS domain-containing protein
VLLQDSSRFHKDATTASPTEAIVSQLGLNGNFSSLKTLHGLVLLSTAPMSKGVLMLCPACGHDNLPGVDRCEGCMAPLMKLDVPQPKSGLQERLMEDSIAALNPAEAITVTAEAPVSEAVELMNRCHVGCILVMDARQLAGIFSERDVLLKLAGTDRALDEVPVKEVMTDQPVVLSREDSIRFALHEMSVGGFRHIPLVSGDGPPSIISIRDVLAYVCAEIRRSDIDNIAVASNSAS